MGILSSVILAVSSGLVATFFAWVIVVFYKRAIEPAIEEWVYKDTRVDGPWTITYEGIPTVEALDLKQVAHRIQGDIVVKSGPDTDKQFKVEGIFRNRILSLTYTPKANSALDRGCFVVQLVNNGDIMTGCAAYYLDSENDIISRKITLTRKHLAAGHRLPQADGAATP